MSKLKFGAIIVDGRGKLGGQVYSKARSGNTLRNKVTPSNPQTTAQTGIRTRLATFAQGWRALTQDQRNAWNAAVGNFASTNIFGQIRNPSGINLYTMLNANLAEIGIAAITVPPLPGTVTGPLTLTLAGDQSAQTLSLAYTATPVPANNKWLIRATPQMSPGVSFMKGKYKNLAVLAAAAASPANIAAAYIAKFGALVTGQKIGIEVVAVNSVTGQKSPPLTTTTIVVA